MRGLMAGRPGLRRFLPLSLETVQALPLEVVTADQATNTALLKFSRHVVLDTPDHLLGNVENVMLGTSLVCLGFPSDIAMCTHWQSREP